MREVEEEEGLDMARLEAMPLVLLWGCVADSLSRGQIHRVRCWRGLCRGFSFVVVSKLRRGLAVMLTKLSVAEAANSCQWEASPTSTFAGHFCGLNFKSQFNHRDKVCSYVIFITEFAVPLGTLLSYLPRYIHPQRASN